MSESRLSIVEGAMTLLEGFEIESREDQVALMAVITFYRSSQTHYPGIESKEVVRLLEAAEDIYTQYLVGRLTRMGAVLGGVRLYDQLLLGAITHRDTQEAFTAAKSLGVAKRRKEVKVGVNRS